ncbi:hypothetical protein JHK87_028478 [Glycine soja]|nr:hypothetical protein JHK87_028478 [Glycine soja]
MVLPSHPIGPTLTKVANQKHLRLHKVVVSCHRHQPLVRGQSSERIMHLSPFENMQHPLFGRDRTLTKKFQFIVEAEEYKFGCCRALVSSFNTS